MWAPNYDYLAFSHDAGGRLTEKWFPNGTTARYAWNADDSLQTLENRTASNAILTSHAYQYDTLGRRVRHAETIGSLGTKYLQYGFDALSRLTQSQTCTTSVYGTCTTDETLSYDILDNRKTRTAAGATLAYVYDAAHQLKETRTGSDTGPLLSSYTWDANGNLTGRPGQTLVWTPDNRLAGIGAETYAYDAQGRRIQKTVAGQATHYLYQGPDLAAEYASWTAPQAVYTHGPAWDNPLIRTTGATSGPDAIARYYHADGLGSAVAMSGNGQTRINAVREPGVAFTEGSGGSYTVGGVASNVNTLKDGDRSAASGHWTVTSGRTLDIVFAGTREIEEVVLVGNPGLTSNPQPKETDTYATTSSFNVSKYTVQTWNGSAWVTQATVTGNKNVIRHVTFAPVSTTKVRIIPVDDASNGQTNNDNLVSLAEVEVYTTPDSGGAQLQRFDAWGNPAQSAGAAIPQYGYTGREPDATGLIYYRARYYDPTIGRFISRDPAGMPDGVNRYSYVSNNPVNFTDPSGECPWCIGAASSVVLGGVIRGLTGGDVFDAKAIAIDAGLGAVGAGFANKLNQISRLRNVPAPLTTKIFNTSSGASKPISSGVYLARTTNNAQYVGQSQQIATRLSQHVNKAKLTAGQTDDAVRIAVSGSKTSREVAEQRILNQLGGPNTPGVLNKVNPVGGRWGLLDDTSLGVMERFTVPNIGTGLSAAIGSGIGLGNQSLGAFASGISTGLYSGGGSTEVRRSIGK